MNESQIRLTRDELFDLRLKLATLEKKKNIQLYGQEIVLLKQQIEEVKKKMAKQKTELYNDELCNRKSK